MAGKESVAETVCGVAVGFGGGLGVYAQVELGVGVTEASLSRLDVDTFEDEPGGVGPAEVVGASADLVAGSISLCEVPELTGATRLAHSTLSIPHADATSYWVPTCRQATP
jgi:hypothetical protein